MSIKSSVMGTALALAMLAGAAAADNRTIDGSGNNLGSPLMGAAGSMLIREASGCHYIDQIGQMMPRSSPRMVSNALSPQGGATRSHRGLTSMHWQWGQFIDHDFALVSEGHEFAPISVPAGDPWFDPQGTGTAMIPFTRSTYANGVTSPREHANTLTHWIDGSMVYGSDQTRATALRTGTGGRLAESDPGFMVRNTGGLPNGGGSSPDFFLAGDVRANEQVGLTSIHTLFLREHNRLADEIGAANPTWSDEEIYQRARKIVGAQVQAITYNEYLPTLLGGHAPSGGAYDANVDASISTSFSSAAFRLGHTMLNERLLRLNEDGSTFAGGHLNLHEQFFNPEIITEAGSLDAILRGLAHQQANEIDTRVIDDVRNLLFGPPGSGGLDLVALNLQRGRDHGIADYNTMRQDFGLAPVATFDQITSDPLLAAALANVYSDVDNIDAWIGLMAEDHLAGAGVGETLATILVDQFERLRDGDRYFYLWDDDLADIRAEIHATRLSDIILRNTGIIDISANVFQIPAPGAVGMLALGALAATRRRRA